MDEIHKRTCHLFCNEPMPIMQFPIHFVVVQSTIVIARYFLRHKRAAEKEAKIHVFDLFLGENLNRDRGYVTQSVIRYALRV